MNVFTSDTDTEMTLNHTADSLVEILSNPKMKLREKTKFKIIEEIPLEELTSMAQANKDGLYLNLKIGHKNVMLIYFFKDFLVPELIIPEWLFKSPITMQPERIQL